MVISCFSSCVLKIFDVIAKGHHSGVPLSKDPETIAERLRRSGT
jgi:hypothetical protein